MAFFDFLSSLVRLLCSLFGFLLGPFRFLLRPFGFVFSLFSFLISSFGFPDSHTTKTRHSPTPKVSSIRTPSYDISPTSFNVNSDKPSPFLRLPLELRDIVYRMLLTTHYNDTEDLYYSEWEEDFHNWLQPRNQLRLHPAILQANKQIAAEGRRVLYNENQFLVFDRLLLKPWHKFDINTIPWFKRLGEEKLVVAPTLRLSMAPLNDAYMPSSEEYWDTIVTTVDAMPRLLRSMWLFFDRKTGGNHPSDWWIEATVHSKSRSRSAFRKEHVIEALKRLQGFGDVWVNGNLETGDSDTIWNCMTTKAQPNEVVRYLESYSKKAEACFNRMEYAAAWSSWDCMRNYWRFCLEQRERRTSFEGPLEEDMARLWPMMLEANLGQVKLLIHFRQYKAAQECARHPLIWIDPGFSWDSPSISRGHLDSLLRAKYYLCYALTSVALGNKDQGTRQVKRAVGYLLRTKFCSSRNHSDLFEQLRWGIEDHLKWAQSPPKLICRDLGWPSEMSDMYWKLPVGFLPVSHSITICPSRSHLQEADEEDLRRSRRQEVDEKDWRKPTEYLSFWEWMRVSEQKVLEE